MATLERRELANTGLKLSCLGFGASPLGNVFSDVPPADALASVRLALQHGFNFFDTSPFASSPCSTPERCRLPLILAYIIPFPLGDRRLHQCGCYIDGFDFSAERVTRSIDESLARLKLDYVDILHCHDIEFGSLDQIVNETIPVLQKIRETGKARFIGITALVDLLPYLKSKGVAVISASPLAMGLLTDNGNNCCDDGDKFTRPLSSHISGAINFGLCWPRVLPNDIVAYCEGIGAANCHEMTILACCYNLSDARRDAAAHCKEKGKNISKVALQYSLMNKEIATILVGMNSPKQVEENVAAALGLSSLGID
ncbi:L-galactose dehydrogenase [Musa troglodytarum]|uniref:L-galactose dehydrogenase n=1 Tax=Musa troglodytarum TaxID=320322 RepID=A0A9E7GQP2_9LILI|nr:L-galactose dehydrogenase [Musa troglodytarum]